MIRYASTPIQAHLATQHIPQLGEFVEAIATENCSHPRDSGIADDFEARSLALIPRAQRILPGIGIYDHGAEFKAFEALAFAPSPRCAVQSRAG
jgi:hypothetical protein